MDDAFCGGPDGSSLTTNETTLVPAETGQKVAALVFMGDPRHVGGEAFNAGNATAGGVSLCLSTYLGPCAFILAYLEKNPR